MLKFIEDEQITEMIMLFIQKNPNLVKIRPDNKLFISISTEENKNILDKIYELLVALHNPI
jgi:transcription-repair coupling factor (superfamily II helicase)